MLTTLINESIAPEILRKDYRVVACIPAHNEEKTIAKTIFQSLKYVDRVVVCDDGSSDMTADIAESMGAIVLKHPRNMGYGAALATLFSAAVRMEADLVVTLDGDGQHDAAQIPSLLEPLKCGEANLVVGSRFRQGEDLAEVPSYRKFGLEIINGLTKKLTYEELTDAQSGFRAYDDKAIRLLQPAEHGMGASTEILLRAKRAGLRMKEVPARISYGENSSSRNPILHGLEVVLSTVMQASAPRPLLSFGLPGAISILVGLIFCTWTLTVFSETNTIITSAALVALSATTIGLILTITAVILWAMPASTGKQV